MTPAQRLELLKEVGGTKVYEERRKESIKLMGDTDTKKAQVKSPANSSELGQCQSALCPGTVTTRHNLTVCITIVIECNMTGL